MTAWYKHVPTGRVGIVVAAAWLEGHVLLEVAGRISLRHVVTHWRDLELVRVQRGSAP